jgi:hypothetical protein
MKTVTDLLSSFGQITLSEMDNVQLMSRTDTKFVFNTKLLPELLQELKQNYRVLNVDGVNVNDYKTLYYDTDEFMFYHQHQCGKGNRCKVRQRTYVQSDLHFFEVKNKNNKEVTVKKRIKTPENTLDINSKAMDFYHNNAIVNDADLKPKLWVNYARITLVNKHQPERLTLDLNLNFENDDQIKFVQNIVIAELKQERRTKSVFTELMSANEVREFSLSKYCLGIVSLYPEVKQNNFKSKLLTLKKICHEII